MLGERGNGPDDLLRLSVHDAYATIDRMRGPDFLLVGRDVDRLRTFAHGNDCYPPVDASAHWLEHRHAVRTDVGGKDLRLVLLHDQHVGGVLAGTHEPIHAISGGIVTRHSFIVLHREENLSFVLYDSMGTTQRTQV